jgi:hypothetical protein
MIKRISVLRGVTFSLAFSRDGRYLAAGLSTGGLSVFDRNGQWAETFRDTDYGDRVFGLSFAADGRLATASLDGKVRLYDRNFKPVVAPMKAPGGHQPFRIAFSPDGATLAIGDDDAPVVDLLDGHSLAPLPRPNLDGLGNGSLSQVMWSQDGKNLYAGGTYDDGHGISPVLAWTNAGRGQRRALPAGGETVGGLAALPDGGVLVGAMDPLLAVLEPDGRPRWAHPSLKADFRDQGDVLAVSYDGAIVDFGFEPKGKSPLRFDLRARKLSRDPPADNQTIRAKQSGLAIKGWNDGYSPTLDGKPIALERRERSESLAIDPNGNRFVLGTQWQLRALDAKGQPLWRRAVPGVVWAVNITGDRRLAVAAYDDGTIRWHRMDDGRELLALYVLKNKEDWVAWTPEGFYDATPGAFEVLQWQVNRNFDAAADTVPVSAIKKLLRPDALALVLQEQETARALGIADLQAARADVQEATGSEKPPGARLHVLTIGVTDLGSKAIYLKPLQFAGRDAQDVANALITTQQGGLYAEVKPQFLIDIRANRTGIIGALDNMEINMARGAGQNDLAVILFSGHGIMFHDKFYLVPYGVDDSTPATRQSTLLSATEFRDSITRLATHGRVLVLLDACRSTGLISGADIRKEMAAANVTVLTSSETDRPSREDERWGKHGAFAKSLLDALLATEFGHKRAISMAELTAYMKRHLSQLTNGDQQLGVSLNFEGDVFVSGM